VTLGAFGVMLRRGGDAARASTVAFSTLSTGQLLYALACRSEARSGLRDLGDNRVFVAGLGGMLLLQAATFIVPPLRALLGTTPLATADLAVISLGAATPVALREVLKMRRSADANNQGGRRG
jgi:P-type Ca2+ transporter type 2C